MENKTKTRKEILITQFGEGWYNLLKDFLYSEEYFKIGKEIKKVINDMSTHLIPHPGNIFQAFRECNYKDLKLVILGNGPHPYIINNHRFSNGLAYSYLFSESSSVYRPESIKHILEEIEDNLYDGFNLELNDIDMSLINWANQGVLLLNTSLTCERNKDGVHTELWSNFITEVITKINDNNCGIIFCLWGEEFFKYEKLIDINAHYILKTNSSPNQRLWKGNNHFTEINKTLMFLNGKENIINWKKK